MFKIKTELGSANISKTIRFTENINNSLIEISKKNNVSFNNLILQCCKYALDNIQDEDE